MKRFRLFGEDQTACFLLIKWFYFMQSKLVLLEMFGI